MAREIELKLALSESAARTAARHPILTGARSLPAKRLINIYYDTPALDLHQAGVALRLRKQGRQWLQTVKCAGERTGGLSSRPEWEQPYAGSFDFAAIDDARLGRWLSRPRIVKRLQPVCETTFTRRTWQVEPAADVRILIMLDRGAIASGERTDPIIEIEFELVEGSAADLLTLARQFADSIPVRPEPLSKAERGYLLFGNASPRPHKAEPSPLTSDHRGAIDAFRLIALACLSQLQANEVGARTNQEPEYIHQMRVALRRLRSAMRTFSPLLPQAELEALTPRLRELGRTLGETRDWDVLAHDIVGPVRAAFPGDTRVASLEAAILAFRDQSRQLTASMLASPQYGRLMLDLLAFLHDPALGNASDGDVPLREFANERLKRLQRRAVKRAEQARDHDAAKLHLLRIAIKRWRYALEFLAPLYTARQVKVQLNQMERLQADLGLLNDLANAGPRLVRCAGDDAVLREAVALVAGWHGPAYSAVLKRLPADIDRLVKHAQHER